MTLARLSRRQLALSSLALGAGALLSGCGALGAIDAATAPLDTFDLRVDGALAPQAARQLARAVIVEVPEVAGALDTDRILIRPNPLQAEFLPGIRWAEAPGPLWQGLIVRNLEDSGGLRFVGRRPVGPGGDFALIGTLTDFQAELGEGDAIGVHIRFSARLVRESDAAIVAARVFEARQTVSSSDPLLLVQGFNATAETVIPAISRWVLATLGVRATG